MAIRRNLEGILHMDKTRVVMAGCGGMSGAWLGTASKRDDMNIVGLVDINEDAARKRKKDFELQEAETRTELGSMLDRLKPDAVFDCTIPESHVKVTLEAL